MGESVTLAMIMGAQAVLLAAIARLRFKCLPDPESGRCVCLSGCTENSLVEQHEAVLCNEYEVGHGQKVLLVSAKT